MSDDSKTARPGEQVEPADEVEGHAVRVAANEEPTQEGTQEGDDEVEGHGIRVADKTD